MLPVEKLQACHIHETPDFGLAWLDGRPVLLGLWKGDRFAVELASPQLDMVYRQSLTGDAAYLTDFRLEADPVSLCKLQYLDQRLGALVYDGSKATICVPGAGGRGTVPVEIAQAAHPLGPVPYAFKKWRIVTGWSEEIPPLFTWPHGSGDWLPLKSR